LVVQPTKDREKGAEDDHFKVAIIIREFSKLHGWTPKQVSCRKLDCSIASKAEQFHRELGIGGVQVRLGVETSGQERWLERLLADLRMEFFGVHG